MHPVKGEGASGVGQNADGERHKLAMNGLAYEVS